ncbi:uncharacterized protein LOC110726612 [Chenopodium quinoa]|uniref:uncharacterized protein LOC110726612 n=1 Tax=Chenopodium quinoa TaxID=63459 RepID=UPI000B77926B|nr:uncharacterized protein LOC110726612 [Chenopodium quinoa]
MSLCDVARMSMLSRKWRNLCLDIPSLELEWYELSDAPNDGTHSSICQQRPYTEKYVKRVDQVLHNYRDHKKFKSFSLVCCLEFSFANEVNRWINFVAASKGTLQSLTLYFICRQEGFRGLVYPAYTKLHVISGSFLSQFSCLQDLHLDSCVLNLENNDLVLSRYLTTLDLYNVNVQGEVTQWQGILSSK